MPKIKTPKPVTIDFEGYGIQPRPMYPPRPTGVSIKWPGKKSKYWSWGHPVENNCTEQQAKDELKKAYAHPDGILFQNAKFDIDVAETHLGLKPPSWDKIHDTMFLLFLDDPHQKELGLKPSAERILNLPPDEQEAVRDWILQHQPAPETRELDKYGKTKKISSGKNSKYQWGAYIAYAPGGLVGRYADGDVIRTEMLFQHLWKSVCIDRNMLKAYDRERELMPCLLDMERQGVRVDVDRLRSDVEMYDSVQKKLEAWLIKRLGCSSDINLDSSPELTAALIEADVADPSLMGVTASGQVKADKEAIKNGVTDKQIGSVVAYLSKLKTCLNTFMRPWLATAEKSGGFIYTTWNQVRAVKGTRTGRLSSTPNFQNMPKEFDPVFAHEVEGNPDKLPKSPIKDLPGLPKCRGYIVPYEDGQVVCSRDYSQQEPRILAHFEDGELMDQYLENPWIDFHDNAKEHLERLYKRVFKRKPVKNINLGIIYGEGVAALALKNGETYDETKKVRDAIYGMYPGLKTMYADMKRRAANNEPIRTWGDREYYCEPPMYNPKTNRTMTFDYKMVNILIQGSAAECTKEAVIRWYRKRPKAKQNSWHLMLQVHDELVGSCPYADLEEYMDFMKDCMESVEFDVKILSEGSCSTKNWNDMNDYDKKGEVLPPFTNGVTVCPQPAVSPSSRSASSRRGRTAVSAPTASAR